MKSLLGLLGVILAVGGVVAGLGGNLPIAVALVGIGVTIVIAILFSKK